MTNKSGQRIEHLLGENNGVLIASEAIASGIPRNAVYNFVRERGLEKASPGIFMDADVFPDEFYLLQARYPKVVFSHETALYLHDMIDREPVPFSVTVPSSYNASALKNQNVRVHYTKPEWYSLGLSVLETLNGHPVKAYDKERTICDVIRRRAAIDPAAFRQAIKDYARSEHKDLLRLSEYARMMNLESKVQEVMEVAL